MLDQTTQLTKIAGPTERTIPPSWKAALAETPERFRNALLAYVVKYVAGLDKPTLPESGTLGHDVVVEFTGLAKIQFSSFVPFHLIPSEQASELVALLEHEGPGAVLQSVKSRQGKTHRALVIGDASLRGTFDAHIDAVRKTSCIEYFVGGPGPDIEGVLRSYALRNEIPKAFIRTVDTSRGTSWSSSPGKGLDGLINELFETHQPDLVIAFAPARLPATLFALERARQLHLHIVFIDVLGQSA